MNNTFETNPTTVEKPQPTRPSLLRAAKGKLAIVGVTGLTFIAGHNNSTFETSAYGQEPVPANYCDDDPGTQPVTTTDAEGNVTTRCVPTTPEEPVQNPKPPHKPHPKANSKDPRDFYKNPLRNIHHLIPRRIDMGVDYSGHGNIKAVGKGVITVVKSGNSSFWPANNSVVYRLTEKGGRAYNKSVFVAENCTPSHSLYIGKKVTSNTTVCYLHDNSPNLEMGWAHSGSERPLARGYYKEGQKTVHGANFNNFMVLLGAPSGTTSGRSTFGRLRENFPAWPH